MSRKGNCWEREACPWGAMRLPKVLKTGLVKHRNYQTRKEAQQDIFEYIEVFYNRQRLHFTNGYWSPVRL